MLACRGDLQGAPAGKGAAESECAAADTVQVSVMGVGGTAAESEARTDRRTGAIQPRSKPKKVGTAAVLLAGKLDDCAAPHTVPMKAVPGKSGVTLPRLPVHPAQAAKSPLSKPAGVW